MRAYYQAIGEDPFKVLPLTFHTKRGIKDPQFSSFVMYFQSLENKIKMQER
jgi:hypothetical protein